MSRYIRCILLSVAMASACVASGTLGIYTDTMTTTDSTGEDGAAVCSEDADSPCAACLHDSCCEGTPSCTAEGQCMCMFDCISSGTPAVECVEHCGAGMEFSSCAMRSCAADCMGMPQHVPAGGSLPLPNR